MSADMELDEELDEDLLSPWRKLVSEHADSPDRFELTELGEVVLSPRPTGRHQRVILAVIEQLQAQLGGVALPQATMLTKSAGVRCPDVAWLPEDRTSESPVDGPMEGLPPLIVEVLSPTNRKAETAHKIRAYLESGAEEVALVALDGKVTYYRMDGLHQESVLGVELALDPRLFR